MKDNRKLTQIEFDRRQRLRAALITSAIMLTILGSMSLEYSVSLTFMIFLFVFVNGFVQIFVSIDLETGYDKYEDHWRERGWK